MFAWLVMLDPWPSMPSLSGRPPHAISLNPSVSTHPRHGSRVLSRPEKAMLESAPPGQANARSGAIRARAPHTAWLMRRPPSWRAATAAGGSGLTKHPGGAVIVIGRKKPEVLGRSAPRRERSAMWTKFVFMWKSPTIEPRHCDEVPSKSTWISSPVFVTVATIAMVSSEIPSSSTWSVNDQVPSGSSAIARRVKRSVWSRRSATRARYSPGPPIRSTSASSSRSPIRVAVTWASRSPRTVSGARTAFSSRRWTVSLGVPRSWSFDGGMRSPS